MSAGAARTPLDIGRVIGRTFSVLRSNWRPFALIALAFVFMPQALAGWAQLGFNTQPDQKIVVMDHGGDGPHPIVAPDSPQVLPPLQINTTTAALSWGLNITAFFLNLLARGAIIYGVLGWCEGKPKSARTCVTTVASRCWALARLEVAQIAGLLIGGLLLVVPGLIVITRWCLAAPVQVAEGLGFSACLGRSAELTKGRRWSVFILIAVFLIFRLMIVLIGLFDFYFDLIGPSAWLTTMTRVLILRPMTESLIATVVAAGLASLYIELNSVRGPAEPQFIADLFD